MEPEAGDVLRDGVHARTDGFTSLAVLLGAIGVWLGFPLADPIIGLLISIAIFGLLIGTVRSIGRRLLDGVNPGLLDTAEHAILHVHGVSQVRYLRLRWVGHRPQWLANRTHLKASSWKSLEVAWRVHVEPFWGRRAIGEIRHSEVQAWVRRLAPAGQESRDDLDAVSDRLDEVRTRRVSESPHRSVGFLWGLEKDKGPRSASLRGSRAL